MLRSVLSDLMELAALGAFLTFIALLTRTTGLG